MAAYFCKPCEYLGKCIDKGCECGCNACGTLCSAPCKVLGDFCCPVNAPSPIFLSYSFVVCGIPTVVAVVGLASGAKCEGSIMIFFGAMAAINLMLIGFAFYLYHQFSQPYQGVHPQGQVEGNTVSRAGNLFCYDPVVFVYLLTLVAGIVLSILGATWAQGCVPISAATTTGFVTALFWVYLFGGVLVICLSLCVECGRTTTQPMQQHLPVPQSRMSSFLAISGGSLLQRLFFPRANMMISVNGASGAARGSVPSAHPAAHVHQPHQSNSQAPNAGSQSWEPALASTLPPPQQAHNQAQAQGSAQTAAQQAAAAAAKGLRMSVNLLQKASAK